MEFVSYYKVSPVVPEFLKVSGTNFFNVSYHFNLGLEKSSLKP